MSLFGSTPFQVAEGVSTAGAVIALAQKYKVRMPVLTAVARIIDNELTPKKAVLELMNLPQVHSFRQYPHKSISFRFSLETLMVCSVGPCCFA